MKAILACLAAASTVLASEKVFNIHDDLDAFPQYKIVFDSSSISPDEAQSLLSHNASSYTPANTHGSSSEAPAIPSEHIRIVMPAITTARSLPVPPYAIQPDPTPQPYLCSIPRPSAPSRDAQQIEKERIASLTETERANRRGWELLEGMKGECIYHVKGWWAYEYCYGQPDSMVKQFHPVVDEMGKVRWPLILDSDQAWFILGRAQPADTPKSKHTDKKNDGTQKTLGDEGKEEEAAQDGETKPGDVDVQGKKAEDSTSSQPFIPAGGHIVNRGDTTYLTHHLTSGTRCDLTYRHREIEIQYHCRPELAHDWIAVVKEITTCNYLMVVQTPRLCRDPAFEKKKVSEGLEIRCRKIAEHTREEFEAKTESEGGELGLAELAEKHEEEKVKAAGAKIQYQNGKVVLGGTVIGANKYYPISEREEPWLKQPENWLSSGTTANPDGELVDEATDAMDATKAPKVLNEKTKLAKPTVSGPNVGPQKKDSKVVKMASIKRDHADVLYTVVASGIIGESAWEVMEKTVLRSFNLSPDALKLIVEDVNWKEDGKGEDGQRWYIVVLTGPEVEKGLEIRAVVELEDLLVEGNKAKHKLERAEEGEKLEKVGENIRAQEEGFLAEQKQVPKQEQVPEQENNGEGTGSKNTEEENLGGSEEEMVDGVKDEL